MSGGQKQRVSIARTLVMQPKILLLDEPLSALDGVIKESIKERIKSIAREFNLTTIIVTHDRKKPLPYRIKSSLLMKVQLLNLAHLMKLLQRQKSICRRFYLKGDFILSDITSINCLEKHMLKTNKIMKLIFLPILLFFLFFLIVPLLYMFWQSFKIGNVVTTQNYIEALRNIEIREAFTNSFKVSFVASVITTILAFWLAYAVHFTTIHRHTKS